jgi:phosphoribosylformimino-5-aminoimidazole carboxamide ribotide isomerase
MEVIPAIDIMSGGVVRLHQGDFEQITRYANDPLELARQYAGHGARRLHVVDLDGARTGDPTNTDSISALAESGLEIQVGGGIRTISRVARLLAGGAHRVVIGSVAVEARDQVAEWLDQVGPERIILAFDVRLDARGSPEIHTHGWTQASGQSLWPLVEFFLAGGATEFLCTDIARDGTLSGPNYDFYRACTARFPEAEFTASGGISSAADLHALEQTGVTRAVTGKALLDGRLTLEEVRQFSRGE